MVSFLKFLFQHYPITPSPLLHYDDKSAFGSSIVQGRLATVMVYRQWRCAFSDEQASYLNKLMSE